MIEINLLPEELRKEKRPGLSLDIEMDKLKILAGGGFVGILVLVIVFLSIASAIRKKQLTNLMIKEQRFAPQKTQAETIDKEISLLKARMNAVDEITKREFLWAKKLNELSGLVLPGIWFTRVNTDSENRFIIEGSVISKKEEAMASVGKFMENIRAHETFFKDFNNIELESVQRKSTEERDIVDFKIALYFR